MLRNKGESSLLCDEMVARGLCSTALGFKPVVLHILCQQYICCHLGKSLSPFCNLKLQCSSVTANIMLLMIYIPQ